MLVNLMNHYGQKHKNIYPNFSCLYYRSPAYHANILCWQPFKREALLRYFILYVYKVKHVIDSVWIMLQYVHNLAVMPYFYKVIGCQSRPSKTNLIRMIRIEQLKTRSEPTFERVELISSQNSKLYWPKIKPTWNCIYLIWPEIQNDPKWMKPESFHTWIDLTRTQMTQTDPNSSLALQGSNPL